MPAYLIVLGVGAWWYRRFAQQNGVWLPVTPWVLILVPMMVCGASLSRLGFALDNELVQVAAPCLTNAAAVAVVGVWLSSRRLLITAVAMALATVVAVLVTSGDRAVSLQLFAYGLLLWHASRSSGE